MSRRAAADNFWMPWLHSPTLLVAFAIVVSLASVVSLAVHRQQQGRRGARWWLVANAILAGALVLQSMSEPVDIGTPIAAVLALQWSILTLAGIRRFYARGGTRISEWHDGVAFVVAAAAAIASWIEPIELASAPKVHAVAAFATDKTKASGYTDTGVTLVTDKTVAGVESKDTKFGLENCWG